MCKTILYKSATNSVSYDATNWYINNIPQIQGNDVNNVKEKATVEAFKMVSGDIINYTNHFKNLVVLAAAGTSIENGNQGGKTRDQLWTYVEDEINAIKNEIKTSDVVGKKFEEIIKEKDIEKYLSLLILYEKLNGEIRKGENILRVELEKKISSACQLQLDENNIHHQDFIRKLTARKASLPRVQLYTTNYDTLFEQAAQRMNYTIIDGFSFSYPRIFNGANFDRDIVFRDHTRIKQEESFVPNVIKLFKLHGSIDWESIDGKIYQKEYVKKPCIIYPASDKYEISYEQPYFEMMSHLQATVRKESTLLIVVGFGFKDKHIQNIIKEAVLQNQNFHLLVVCYGKKERHIGKDTEYVDSGITHELVPEYFSKDGKIMTNVTILFSKFKEFVDNYPYNSSYSEEDKYKNEAF